MNKRNGFTLVELLAVIVVLALIMIISIPSILNTTVKTKKKNFYLFAQSLNSKATDKYIQDQDETQENTDCAVYDIATDLGISNVGDYEGWVKVLRTPIFSGKKSAVIELSSQVPMENAKYCIAKGSQCTPNTAVLLKEGDTKTKIVKTINEGFVMCANYQYGSNGSLVTSDTTCQTYDQGLFITDNYKYDIKITLTDKNYVIQDYLISESSTEKEFYELIDQNKKSPPSGDTDNPTKIASPRCQIDAPITYKGLSNHETTKVTTSTTTSKTCNNDPSKIDNKYDIKFNTYGGTKINSISFCTTCSSDELLPKPTRNGYTFDGWYYDSDFKNKVNGLYVRNVETTEKRDTGNCLIGYKDVQLYAKWNRNGTTTTTEKTSIVSDPTSSSEKTITVSTEPTTSERTTHGSEINITEPIDITDTSILLKDLIISDYDIGFDPHKFTYNLNVPNNVTDLYVTYQAMEEDNENIQVFVQGEKNLGVGSNHVSIDVYNTLTGKRAVYNVIVKRFNITETYEPYPTRPIENWNPSSGLPDPSLEESNALLRSLIVSGYVFGFDPQVYNYNLEIKDEESLNVTYRAQSNNAIVVVTGTDNIKDGSKIIVNVQSQNGYYHKTYTINLIRKIPESNTTKVLRAITIGLATLLGVILIVTFINKNSRRRMIAKKEYKPNDQTDQKNE